MEEVRAAVQALGPDVQSVLGDNLSDLAYRRRDANGYLERITVAQGLEAIRQQVPGLAWTTPTPTPSRLPSTAMCSTR